MKTSVKTNLNIVCPKETWAYYDKILEGDGFRKDGI
jgi:hypothetical protein